jgi:UDP-galactose transporter B1
VGVLFGSKHSAKKAVTAVVVCLGISVFFLGKGSKTGGAPVNSFGIFLVCCSLLSDGFVGAIQGRIRHSDPKISPFKMMFLISFWSIFLIFGSLVANGQLLKPVHFILRFPQVLSSVLMLNGSMAIGQLFIFLLIAEFDPLVCSLTTTTRKFFSILASIIIYGNPINSTQWGGIALVFCGLLLPDVFLRLTQKKTDKPKQK